MLKYLTGAAALALAASAVHADPGGGKGGGNGKGGGAAHEAHGGGNGKGNGGGNGGSKADRGPEMRGGGQPDKRSAAVQADRRSGPVQADRGQGKAKGPASERDDRGRTDRVTRGNNGSDVRRAAGRDGERDDVRVVGRDRDGGFRWDDAARASSSRGLIDGCPPGLAAKNNGCMPPGQLKDRAAFYDRSDWWNFDRRYAGDLDGRYRYYDGYMVRYGDNGIDRWLPLLGGALAPGNIWPSSYQPVALPTYYQDYYGLGPVDGYRYYDNVLYRVDPQTQAINSVAALLTGNDFVVGQQLPLGYDVYNVPYAYRDRYVDGPDAYYRYSDGYVYQVDPTTQLIQAAIELLT